MEDTLVATVGNWLKLTVHAMQDYFFSVRVLIIESMEQSASNPSMYSRSQNCKRLQLESAIKQMDFFMDN